MSDQFAEDEFLERPDDDEMAFVHYEKKFRAALDRALDVHELSQSSYNHHMRTYINGVLATAQALNLPFLDQWTGSSNASDSDYFERIKFDIDNQVIQIRVRHATVRKKHSVKLDATSREKIRDLITKIKLTIESLDIPVSRRESLIEKLNAFSAEVDRDRTKFEAFAALAIEASGVANKVERKLRPIRKWIDSIAGLLKSASDLEKEAPQLPPPRKQIEPPRVRKDSVPPRITRRVESDDDIPF